MNIVWKLVLRTLHCNIQFKAARILIYSIADSVYRFDGLGSGHMKMSPFQYQCHTTYNGHLDEEHHVLTELPIL